MMTGWLLHRLFAAWVVLLTTVPCYGANPVVATKPVVSTSRRATDEDMARVDAAFARLTEAKDWRAEQAATKELAALGKFAIDKIQYGAKEHEKERVRRACYELILNNFVTNELALATVIEHGLKDQSNSIRYSCAFRLGELKAYGSYRHLRALIAEQSTDKRTRYAAAKSLAQLGEGDSIVLLYHAMQSDNYMPRMMAAVGCKALTGKNADDFEGYEFHEEASVFGGIEAWSLVPDPVGDSEKRAKRFQAIAAYFRWLRDERPDLYKHFDDTF